jgi:hypothetical protein
MDATHGLIQEAKEKAPEGWTLNKRLIQFHFSLSSQTYDHGLCVCPYTASFLFIKPDFYGAFGAFES